MVESKVDLTADAEGGSGTEIRNQLITIAELDIIDQANEEMDRYGKTAIACPRCGMPLHQEINGTGTIMKCETANCLRVIYRGI